eukprot:gene4569-9080_t
MSEVDGINSVSACASLNDLLSKSGCFFDPLPIYASTTDVGVISTSIVDSWASSVLAAVSELLERDISQRDIIQKFSLHSRSHSAWQDSHEFLEIAELTKKLTTSQTLLANTERKKNEIEALLEQRDSSAKKLELELKRQIKGLQGQVQESERRVRRGETELDRLKAQLKAVADRDREQSISSPSDPSRRTTNTSHRTPPSATHSPRGLGSCAAKPSPTHTVTRSPHSPQLSTPKRHDKDGDRDMGGEGPPLLTPGSRSSAPKALIKSSSPRSFFVTENTWEGRGGGGDLSSSSETVLELRGQVKDLIRELKRRENKDIRGGGGGGSGSGVSVFAESDWDRDKDGDGVARRLNDQQDNSDDIDEHDSSRGQQQQQQQHGFSGAAGAMLVKIKEQSQCIQCLSEERDELSAQLRHVHQALTSLKSRLQEACDENENLQLELSTRPTLKQWMAKQNEVKVMEEKLQSAVSTRREMDEYEKWKRHLSTSDRIRADKKNHELQLWLLDTLPRVVMKDTLQALCRSLDLSELSEIVPCVEKLKAVVGLVPRLESFVSKVCNFVFGTHQAARGTGRIGDGDDDLMDHGDSDGDGDGVMSSEYRTTTGTMGYLMEDILPILARWRSELCILEELKWFKSELLRQIGRRDDPTLTTGGQSVENRRAPHKQQMHVSNACSEVEERRQSDHVIAVVRDLVDLETGLLRRQEAYRDCEGHMESHPDVLIHQLVNHIMHLFEVRGLEGFLPRMNQIYLFVVEMRTFLNNVRMQMDLKGVPDSVVLNNIMCRVSEGGL